jgi:hypothetical protein
LARVRRGRRTGFLTDAFAFPDFARQVIAALAAGKEVNSGDGVIYFRPMETGRAKLASAPEADVHWLAAEQSNSSLTIGDTAILKIYRRISPGQHPEAEMNRYLTAEGFTHAPSLLGDVVRIAPDGAPSTLAIALEFVRNESDAWAWILDHLHRARCPCTGPRRGGLRGGPICRLRDYARRHRPALGRDTRNWCVRRPMPHSRPRSPALAMRPIGQRRLMHQKAFEEIAQLQTWERDQDHERHRSF